MLLLTPKPPLTLVMIVGYKDPANLIDSAEAFEHWHRNSVAPFKVVFAIDDNESCAAELVRKRGEKTVFNTPSKNGWGRGVLKTIIQALDYFSERTYFSDLLTLDDDTLAVGPFLDEFHARCHSPNDYWLDSSGGLKPLFAGELRPVLPDHEKYYYELHRKGFLCDRPLSYQGLLIVGPCMLWTKFCLNLLFAIGLRPATAFEEVYQHFYFSHDHLGGYMAGVGLGTVVNTEPLGQTAWRAPLEQQNVLGYGLVPMAYPGAAFLHPLRCDDAYDENIARAYFRNLRSPNRCRVI